MGYSSAQAKAFINQIAPLIQAEAKKRGYLVCSPVIAQAICESAANTSSLGYKYNNFFGLKCGTAWKGKSVNLTTKEEYKVGTLTTIKDNFRVYDSMAEGVAGYFDFISTKRYSNLKKARTPLEYLTMIKNDGYATSSTYVNTNMNIISKYDLSKYDTISGAVTSDNKTVDELALEVIDGKWGTGNNRKVALQNAGYNYSEVQKRVNEILSK